MPWHQAASTAICTVLLCLSLLGCGQPGPRPTPSQGTAIPPSTPALDLDPGAPPTSAPPAVQLELIEAVIETIVQDIAYHATYLIAQTVVEDEHNLWFGTSVRAHDVQQCWLAQAPQLAACTADDLATVFQPGHALHAAPRIFFAIAVLREREALVIVDYYHSPKADDPVDGWRIVFDRSEDAWRESSRQSVY